MEQTQQTNQAPNPKLYDLAGQADNSVAMEEVQGNLESFPIYGVSDFVKGQAVRGTFLGNQTRGKDKDGNPRVIHVLQNAKGEKFGLWERTTTSRPFGNITAGKLVDVIYDGVADKHPTDPMKSPPHLFRILAAKA